MADWIVDLVNDAQIAAFGSAGITTTTQGSSADFSNAGGPQTINAILNVMTTGAVTTAIAQIEESTDGTNNWTLIAGMQATVTNVTAATNLQQVLRGQRSKRYVRANVATNTAATTPGIAFNILIIGQKKYTPSTSAGSDLYPSS